jgi:NAD(P)-dependent dehydrogenase (short-subunit alcohol dehydrogenase family)
MAGSLDGRVVLVSGAGNGLGQAIALRLAREGAIVGVNDLRAEFTAGTVAKIRAAGGEAEDLPGDASQREVVRATVLGLAARRGRFDVIVNNAAWVRYGEIGSITEKTYERMTAIGFGGVVWGIQAAAEAMGEKGGSIINIASSAAFLGMPGAMVYCGIKAGVTGLTRSASAELGPRGIRVNAIAPGSTKTEAVMAMLSEEKVAMRVARTPLRRMGEPGDIAEMALFLASDASSYVTGSVMLVDGGVTHAFG